MHDFLFVQSYSVHVLSRMLLCNIVQQQEHSCACRKPILFGPSKDGSGINVATAIKGRFSMARSNQHRGIDMSIEYSAQYSNGSYGSSDIQIFSMTMSS